MKSQNILLRNRKQIHDLILFIWGSRTKLTYYAKFKVVVLLRGNILRQQVSPVSNLDGICICSSYWTINFLFVYFALYKLFLPQKNCSKISGRYINWYNLFSVFWQHMSKHLKTISLKISYPGVHPKQNLEFIQKDIYVRIYWAQVYLLITQKPIVTTKIVTIHKNIRFTPRLACWEDRRRTIALGKEIKMKTKSYLAEHGCYPGL